MVVKVLDDAGFVDPIANAKRDRRGRERVVHDTVKGAIGPDPTLGFVPDLAGDVRLGVRLANSASELVPKAGGADLIWYVEAPAVDSFFDPIGSNAPQEFADRLVFGVELRQRVQAPPRVVSDGCVLVVWSDREVSNVEPVEER